jgi:long-chain acyl-CoA synthetase
MTTPRTVVHLLHAQAERLKERPAHWTRRGPSWRPVSWREYAQRVKELANGLIALGFRPGDALAIVSFNREEWAVGSLAAMAAGGRVVGAYTTCSQEQLSHLLIHSAARFALVENPELARRVAAVAGGPEHLLVIDAMGPRVARERTLGEVLELGGATSDSDYYARLDALREDDVAALIYTSGTTGPSRGVLVSHRNLTWTTERLGACHPTSEDDVLLSYLPLAHVAEQVLSLYLPLSTGLQVYFARGPASLPDDLLEVRPTVFFGVPRVWEKLQARIEAGLEREPPARQRLIAWARDLTRRSHADGMEHLQSHLRVQGGHALARAWVHRPLKARLGLDRARVFAASAAPMSLQVLEFFASFDIVVAEVYGQSEATGPTSVSTPRAVKLGAVGRPMPGVQVRLGADREILVRGGNVCLGYFRDEAASAALLEDGWLHSGDLGAIDQEGFLSITGRKKELLVTSGGQKTSPVALEQLLSALEPLGPALVVGDRRAHLGALLTLDRDRVPAFARRHGWPASPEALAGHPDFRRDLTERIERQVNARLARFEAVRAFEVLAGEFSVATGELTPTFKLRRAYCEQKYADQVDRLYVEAATRFSSGT